jgi:hypothetical protein
MTDIANLIDNAKKNGLKIVLNPNHVDGGREYYLCDKGLSKDIHFIYENRIELGKAYLHAMPEIIKATGKKYAWYPEELEVLQKVEETLAKGKPVVITADGTLDEFVVQDNWGRYPKPINNANVNKIGYNLGQKPFSIECNLIG